jgi:hypothetical protein
MKKILLFLMIVAVYVLHQDAWNWNRMDLTFDILPIGLAYHAGYSLLAAAMMSVLVSCAWPKELEDSEPKNSPPDNKDGEDRK